MVIEEYKSLRTYNTFDIQATARRFASFSTQDELGELLDFARSGARSLPRSGIRSGQLPLLILGGGSNILLTGDFDGMVLHNKMMGVTQIREDEHHVYVQVGAGENWDGFVRYCLERNWAGVENLSLIPGNVGASPMQNIGAYGVEIKEVFYELEAWHREENKVYAFSVNDCAFGYRESVFKGRYKDQFVILNVTYRLNKVPKFHTEYGSVREELEKMGVQDLSIQAISQAVIRIRRSKLPDPAEIGNAGSFFKNPEIPATQFGALQAAFPDIPGYPLPAPVTGPARVKVAAGWLIEQCGWKGFRRGDAGCHARQALVLVNYGQATGKEILDLSEEILQSVKTKFGITLDREVNVVSSSPLKGE